MSDPLAGVVFPFEDLGEALHLLPLAARRALDAAGYRLSLEAWQSLSGTDRTNLTLEGAKDAVDGHAIEPIVKRASIPATRIKPVPDPDPLSPPEQLNAALVALPGADSAHGGDGQRISPAEWSRLRALDRYALLHVLRRSIAHDDTKRLASAVRVVLGRATPPAERGAEIDPRRTMRSKVPSYEPPADLSADLERASEPPRHPSERPRPYERKPASIRPKVEEDVMTVRPGDAPSDGRDTNGGLTHIDRRGAVHMVDIAEKPITARRAVASGIVRMRRETAERLLRGDGPKGEVVATARLAGILAAKRTPELIPLAHTVALTRVEVAIHIDVLAGRCDVTATAEAMDRTGVEMEALTATSVACLTLYDMLKSIDRDMVVSEIKLVEKSGGRSGPYTRADGK